MLISSFRRRRTSARSAQRDCIHCGCRVTSDGICGVCKLDHGSALAGELTDLAATERQLRRFLGQAHIDDATYQQLHEKIGSERRRLLQSLPHVKSLVAATQPPVADSSRFSRAAAVAGPAIRYAAAAAAGILLAAWPYAHLQTFGAFICGLALFVLFAWAALRRGWPTVHLLALPFFVLGFSAAMLGDTAWDSLQSPRNGWILLVPVFMIEIIALLLKRRSLAAHAVCYGLAGAALACCSIGLVARPARGLEDPAGAAALCALMAGAGFVVNRWWRSQFVGSCCCALVVMATLWAIWWQSPRNVVAWSTMLAIEALLFRVISIRLSAPLSEGQGSSFRAPLVGTGPGVALLALLAVPAAAWLTPMWSPHQIATGIALGAFFLLHAIVERRTPAVVMSGLCGLGAIISAGGCLASVLADLPNAPSTLGTLGTAGALAGVGLALIARTAHGGPSSRMWMLEAFRAPAAVAGFVSLAFASIAAYNDSSLLSSYSGAMAALAFLILAAGSARSNWVQFAAIVSWCVIAYSLGRGDSDVLVMLPVIAALAPVTRWSPRLIYICGAGLQVNVIAGLIWRQFGAGALESLLITQVICLPLSAGVARMVAQRAYGVEFGARRAWFDRLQLAAGLLVATLSLAISLDLSQTWMMRMWAPASLVLIVPSLLLLVPSSSAQGSDRSPNSLWQLANVIRYFVLSLGFLAACESGWTLLDAAGRSSDWLHLHRSIVAVAAGVGVAVLYSVLSYRMTFADEWNGRLRIVGTFLACSTLAGVVWILGLEAQAFWMIGTEVPIAATASLFVVALLVAQVVTALRWGNRAAEQQPSSNVSFRYLCAAEAGVFLLFAHGRFTVGGSSWLAGLTASVAIVAAAIAWQWISRGGSLRAYSSLRSENNAGGSL